MRLAARNLRLVSAPRSAVSYAVLLLFSTATMLATMQPLRASEAALPNDAAAANAPRIIQVTPRVYVAVDYDYSNVILVATPDGNVVIDTAMSANRARGIRAALADHVPGPVRAIILTHSHIDHTGGTAQFIDDEAVDIWATAEFEPEILRRYGTLRDAEIRRGIREFGLDLGPEMPLRTDRGPTPEPLATAGLPSIRMPTHTFRDHATLTVGGVELQLFQAPGASPDHLFVWIPSEQTLLTGENFCPMFPRLHALRSGTPVVTERWIGSLDKMRQLDAQNLVPSHGPPTLGAEASRTALTDYRDAIAYLRDATVRGINCGDPAERIAHDTTLPPHLANHPYLGASPDQIRWAVLAIHAAYVGWGDDRPERLFAVDPRLAAAREVNLLGGPDAVLTAAEDALTAGDPRWALHLLAKLRDSERVATNHRASYDRLFATALNQIKSSVAPPAERNYLASIVATGDEAPKTRHRFPRPSEDELQHLTIDALFHVLPQRLKAEETFDLHESIGFYFSDVDRKFTLTIRHGVAEVTPGVPHPDGPKTRAVIVTDTHTWRKLCMGIQSPASALVTGAVRVHGNTPAAQRFMRHFRRTREFRTSPPPRLAVAAEAGS